MTHSAPDPGGVKMALGYGPNSDLFMTFEKVYMDEAKVCVCVCLYVCGVVKLYISDVRNWRSDSYQIDTVTQCRPR